jgi:hypothetical protein
MEVLQEEDPALIIVWPKTMLYGRDIDCNLLFWPGYYTNAEPSGPNDDQGRRSFTTDTLKSSSRSRRRVKSSFDNRTNINVSCVLY